MQKEPDVHELKAWKKMMKGEDTEGDGMECYCCLMSETFDGIGKGSEPNCYSHRKRMR